MLVLALAIAVGSAQVFGVSMALGAFLAGMVVGRSEYSLRAASEALPMRDAFAVLFFVSVGMLLDPTSLLDDAGAGRWQRWRWCSSASRWRRWSSWLLMRYPFRVALAVRSRWRRSASSRSSSRRSGATWVCCPPAAMNTIVAVVDRLDRPESAALPAGAGRRAVGGTRSRGSGDA